MFSFILFQIFLKVAICYTSLFIISYSFECASIESDLFKICLFSSYYFITFPENHPSTTKGHNLNWLMALLKTDPVRPRVSL